MSICTVSRSYLELAVALGLSFSVSGIFNMPWTEGISIILDDYFVVTFLVLFYPLFYHILCAGFHRHQWIILKLWFKKFSWAIYSWTAKNLCAKFSFWFRTMISHRQRNDSQFSTFCIEKVQVKARNLVEDTLLCPLPFIMKSCDIKADNKELERKNLVLFHRIF